MRKLIAFGALALCSCKTEAPTSAPVGAPSPKSAPSPSSLAVAGPSTRLDVTFQSGPNKLVGFLWLPATPGPHRAVVFNHGSERDPGDDHELARFYNEHDFVFFVPVRRGHGKSQGAYIIEKRDEAGSVPDRQRVVVEELVAQVDDVVAAHAYLSSRPDVRKDAIAVTGCSFGGIEVVFTVERATPYKAAVDFAGGAMSWKGSPLLRERMTEAVRRATLPILFVQAENDFSTAPSAVLSAEMDRLSKPNRKIIYPARGATAEAGHGLCGVADVWGTDVLAWLDHEMP